MKSNQKLIVTLAISIMFAGNAIAQWYSGGTLHNANGAEWSRAANSDRLATSADFVVRTFGEDKIRTLGSINKIKPLAQELKDCIDEASVEGPGQRMQVSRLAAACAVLMGWV